MIITQNRHFEVPFLDPKEFQLAWGMPVEKAAEALGISPITFRSYSFQSTAKGHRTPPRPICALAGALSYYLLSQEVEPENPELVSHILDLLPK
ncbi:MAG: hypothetical protein F6J93_31330 [Oscillatoria sp. SIO1A7]|nr:hypothetical protein [Oscillatoria sp. SIO1A7]